MQLQHKTSELSQGLLQFTDLSFNRRLPASFSRGFPRGVTASWKGKWIVRDCHKTLHESSEKAEKALVPATGFSPLSPVFDTSGMMATAVLEQASTVAHLRFSSPVLVRGLVARWSPSLEASPAVVAGRLEQQSAWTTHLDPQRVPQGEWMELSGGPLVPVEEIAFLGAKGLELGAVWVLEPGTEEQEGLVLRPVAPGAQDDSPFLLQKQNLTSTARAVTMSLSQMLRENWRLNLDPATWSFPASYGPSVHYPSLISTETAPIEKWSTKALSTQLFLEGSTTQRASFSSRSLALAYVDTVRSVVPRQEKDLSKALREHRDSIADALAGEEDEEKPEELQARLDLLTAAMLHGQ